MDYQEFIKQLDPTMIANFKRAIEIGKWPDGNTVTPEQREHCMAAVIAYEQQYVPEHERVGYIDRGSKADGEVCADEPTNDQPSPLKWS